MKDDGLLAKHFPRPELPVCPRARRALGCRLGQLRHLLQTGDATLAELAGAVRRVPELEAFLVQGMNKSLHGLREPVRAAEDVLERWGLRRTQGAVALFERRLYETRPEDARREHARPEPAPAEARVAS